MRVWEDLSTYDNQQITPMWRANGVVDQGILPLGTATLPPPNFP
jgi:hypothetical protein